jgi:hypothetical protein
MQSAGNKQQSNKNHISKEENISINSSTRQQENENNIYEINLLPRYAYQQHKQ